MLKFMTKAIILNPLNLKPVTKSDHVLPKISQIDFSIQGSHPSYPDIPSNSISCLNLLPTLEMKDPNQAEPNSMKYAQCLQYLFVEKTMDEMKSEHSSPWHYTTQDY